MRREIVIIGTLHAGLTPNRELKDFLEHIKPNQLLVEITEEDVNKKDLDSYDYPPEMIYAVKWAKNNNIAFSGFDSSLSTLCKGITEADNLKAIKDSKQLIRDLSWKDMNKEKNIRILEPINKRLVDPFKDQKRNSQMIKNIKSKMIRNSRVVIITGCGHLNYFEKHIKDAIFPFR